MELSTDGEFVVLHLTPFFCRVVDNAVYALGCELFNDGLLGQKKL